MTTTSPPSVALAASSQSTRRLNRDRLIRTADEGGVPARGLGKRYGDRWVLRDLDLSVPAGTVLGLLGHNGAGKTTTVRLLTTLALPTTGNASVAGFDVTAAPERVRSRIGVAAQEATVDGLLSAAYADERSIVRLQAGPGHKVEYKEVAGRVWGCHTDPEAFEVGIGLERLILANSEHNAGKPAKLNYSPDVVSHGLRPQYVLVRARCNIDRPRTQGIESLPTAFKIAHRDGKSVGAEMSPPLRDGHRQIIEMRLIGDAKLERGAFKLLPMDWIEKSRAQHEACRTSGECPTVVVHRYGLAKELHRLRMIAPLRHPWQSLNLEYQTTTMRCISQSIGARLKAVSVRPRATDVPSRPGRRGDRIVDGNVRFWPPRMSALGSKADIAFWGANVRF